jgi:hypothetical protein
MGTISLKKLNWCGIMMWILRNIKVLCEDTFFRGAFCGAVAGVLKDIFDLIFYFFTAKEIFFWSFASVVAFDQLPKDLFMNIIAVILEIIFSAFLGIVFALIVPKMKTPHFLFMGIFYGSMVWFFIRAIIVSYKIIELKQPPTAIRPVITWILSMIFGVILSWLERRLSPKTS